MAHIFTANVVALCAFIIFFSQVSEATNGLKMGFYKETCPSFEKIVRSTVKEIIHRAPAMAPTLLRMHFHDCFVRGCDGSVLLNSTAKSKSEKDAIPNLTVRGFNVIDLIKVQLEKHCPGVVSCADILSVTARDAIFVTFGGPYWDVPTGRKDGLVSVESDALRDIPAPSANFSALKASFARKGLTVRDLVVLSGGHTIGISHCGSFSRRLFNFTGKGDTDPSMDRSYAAELRNKKCTTPRANSIVEMDPGSFMTVDTSYYYNLKKHRGLLQSDAALLTDPEARSIVNELSVGTKHDSIRAFFKEFRASMQKMSAVGVLTGSQGEIRRHCSFVNKGS